MQNLRIFSSLILIGNLNVILIVNTENAWRISIYPRLRSGLRALALRREIDTHFLVCHKKTTRTRTDPLLSSSAPSLSPVTDFGCRLRRSIGLTVRPP